MKPIGTKQVKEFDFPLASKAAAKSEEKREIEAQVEDQVLPEELDADMSDYTEQLEAEVHRLFAENEELREQLKAIAILNKLRAAGNGPPPKLTRDDIVGIMGNLQAAGVAAYLSEGILGRTKRASVSVRVQGKEIVSTEYDCPSGDIDNRNES